MDEAGEFEFGRELFVLELIVKFVSVSALLTVLPGPNTLVVARNALHDRLLAVTAALGTAAGALTWGVAAAIGLAAVLHRSSQLYQAVKLTGAAYLIFLGVATIWSTLRRRRQAQADGEQPPPVPVGRAAAFRAGFVSDVLNPKTGIFYVAVVPQLIPDDVSVLHGTLLFSTLDAAVTAAWFTVIGFLVARLALHVYNPRVLRVAERVTGLVLIGLGVRTAVERS